MSALSPDEAALFDDLPPIEDDETSLPDPKPTAPPSPAATATVTPPAPTASSSPAGVTCACNAVITPENGSKLQDGTWKHIGCPLTAPPPPATDPASKPPKKRKMPITEAATPGTAADAPPPTETKPATTSAPAEVKPAPLDARPPQHVARVTEIETLMKADPKRAATLLRAIADLIDPA